MISWWFSRGWGIFATRLFDKLHDTADFFSISSLVKTLFAPFRQISAGVSTSAALDARLRAFFDRLVSRIIGAIVRIGILIFGGIVLLLQLVFSLVMIVAWPVLPFGIIIFSLMAMMGVRLW